MIPTIRELRSEDQSEIDELCETIWSGNDYVPEAFPTWVTDDSQYPYGTFIDNELVSIACLKRMGNTTTALVQGLRVKEGYRGQGHGVSVVQRLIEVGKEIGLDRLWYATSTRNKASMGLAEKVGFHRAVENGYFRIDKPYPPHPKPSIGFLPLEISAERLYEVLIQNPDLIEQSYFPLSWNYYQNDKEGILQIPEKARIRIITTEEGTVRGLYIHQKRSRNEQVTYTYSVYSTDRAIFVDMISRIMDEVHADIPDRTAFFTGPRAEEWMPYVGILPDDHENRCFVLYELII